MSARIDFRAPRKHKQMIKDLARHRGVSDAEILREALTNYLSTYSRIPSLKQLYEQVDRHETKLAKIEKALLKKGIME